MSALCEIRQREIKAGAFSHRPLGPHPPAVAVDDALDVGEPDARALELGAAVQALEDAEEPVHVAHVETYAVVSDRKDDLMAVAGCANFDSGPTIRAGVLEGIADEVLEHEPHELRVSLRRGQLDS